MSPFLTFFPISLNIKEGVYMNFKDFLSDFTTAILTQISDEFTPSVQTMAKNNGVIRHAIALTTKTSTEAPLIYIDSYYESYCNGISLDELVIKFLDEYRQCLPFEASFPNVPLDIEQMKPFIFVKAIHYERNLPWLASIPHKRILDLAMIYEFVFPHSMDGYGFSAITYPVLNMLCLNEAELDTLAWENMRRENPPHTFSVRHYIDLTCHCTIHILTNHKKIHGAAYLFDTNVLQAMADYLESDLCIFPSSIHEVIIVPFDASSTKEELNAMVQEVNATEVAIEEQLSDHIYVFHRDIGELSL